MGGPTRRGSQMLRDSDSHPAMCDEGPVPVIKDAPRLSAACSFMH